MRWFGSRRSWYSPKVLFAVLGAAIAIGSTAILDARIDWYDGQRERSANHLSFVQTVKANHYGLYLQSEADRIHAQMILFGASPSMDAATTAGMLMSNAAERAYYSAVDTTISDDLDAAIRRLGELSSASPNAQYRAAVQRLRLECMTALKDPGVDKGYITQVNGFVRELDRLTSAPQSTSSAVKALDTMQQCEVLRYPKYYDILVAQQKQDGRDIASDETIVRGLRQQSRFLQVLGVIVILCKDLFGKET
jgi:hypothetical protein